MQINQRISTIKSELDNIQINKQRKRYLESELDLLIAYQEKHPEKLECPTDLEIYCDSNPDALECRMYEI